MTTIRLPANKLAPWLLFTCSALIATVGALLIIGSNRLLLEWELLDIITVPLKFRLILDPIGLLYRTVVLFIAANVIIFSKFYMANDLFINRFTALVILFVISINMLIFIPHLVMLLLGWDGLGITSFILVVYYINPKSLAAGMITALTNRVGDVIILLCVAITLNQGHWNILLIDQESKYLVLQVIFIAVAGITKSAQIPFSRWLPAAIAAPTPVSALVHSSTLVTAGVFLLVRFYSFLRSLIFFKTLILFVAVSTMLIAGIGATTECDIKKIIALSTLRQLGIIMTALGLGAANIAIFHMVTHALFKALLFICAGELIALHSHGQDLRWMGNLNKRTPVASSCIIVANLALCGLPFIAGFYSKDLIIELLLTGSFNTLIISLSILAVGLTTFYSIRFRISVMWAPRLYSPIQRLKESVDVINPILVISTLSIAGGSIIGWLMPEISSPITMPVQLKLIPLLMILAGIARGWLILLHNSKHPRAILNHFTTNYASCSMWFLVPLSSQFILHKPLNLAHRLLISQDQGWLETIGGQGSNLYLSRLGFRIMANTPISITSYSFLRVATAISTLVVSLF